MNKRYKLLLKKLLLCSLLAGSLLNNSAYGMDLYNAMMSENSDIVEKTIREGADVNYFIEQKEPERNADGSIKDSKELIGLIIYLGQYPSKFSLLHLAVDRGLKNIVRTLLEHGANTEVFDSLGNTPLMVAQKQNRTEIIEMLEAASASTPKHAKIAENSFLSHSTKSRPMGPKGRRRPSRFNKNSTITTEPQTQSDSKLEEQEETEPSTNEVSTLDVAQITVELEEQKAKLAELEETKSTEEKELVKIEAKLEEVKILPIEPIAPIKKKRARHKQKIAQKNDAIAVCKREIYLLEQAKLKAARRAAAQEAAAQPKKKATVQDFYGVKKSPKRKSRIRGGRAARRGPARKKSSKRQTAGKKSNKRNAKRKHSMKRKSAKRKQAQQAAE